MFYSKIKSQAEQFLGDYKQDNPATYAAAQEVVGGLLILDGFIGMDNPLSGKKRSSIFGALLGIVAGLIFIFGVGFIGNLIGINKMTSTTTGTVVSVSQSTPTNASDSNSTCTLQAKYTVMGKEYNQKSSISSSGICSLSEGQAVEINYNPNNPSEMAYDLNTIKTVLKISPYVGALIAITSLVTFIIRLLSIIFGWKLLKSGRALAKTLPAGTNLDTIKSEIKKNFAESVFRPKM